MLDTDPTAPVVDAPWSEPARQPSWWDRQEPWSLSALALALIGLRQHQREPARPHRWMAVAALLLALATLAVIVVATSLNRVDFLPFWTDQ